MSGTPIRLTLRQKPHLDFVIGYPGLVTEPPLQPAAVEGTVEVRVQQQAVHTQWLKVELKKTEVVQTSKGIRRYFEVSRDILLSHIQRIADPGLTCSLSVVECVVAVLHRSCYCE